MSLKWTPLSEVQYVTFFDPSNPDVYTYTPQLNPQQEQLTSGDVRQYTQTTNGTAVIIGNREYPPSQLQLTWNQMDVSDYLGIAQMCPISPIVYIDSNDNGYLGVLQLYQSGQIAGMTSNVWTATFNFLVVGPYDGAKTSLPQLSVPTLTAVEGSSGSGFIPNNTDLYFWLTAQTRWGESLVGDTVHVNTVNNKSSIALSWSEPSSNYYLFSRLYWYTSNDSAVSTFLTEVQKGFSTGGTDTFTVYAPYAEYSLVNPPTYGMAYRGYFGGAIFIPDDVN